MGKFVVTFVRHAETNYNRSDMDVVKGATSTATINATGIVQAIKLGKSLQDEVFTKIFCSDFDRCKDTATHVLAQLKTTVPDIVYDIRLRKKDFGEWEGLPKDKLMQAMKEQNCDIIDLQCPLGEGCEDMMSRVGGFFTDLLKIAETTEQDENILIFSHGMTIQCFLRYLVRHVELYNVGEYNHDPDRKGNNTSVTKMTIQRPSSEGSRWKINIGSLLDLSHLKDDVVNV